MRVMLINVMIVLMVIAVFTHCKARFAVQSKPSDSLFLNKQFLNICNHYQQLPLQAKIEVVAVSNYIRNVSDTGKSFMELKISESKTYTRMGEMEEISNDSLLLLINYDANQMVLYANKDLMKKQIERYTKGMIWADSSVKKFAGLFKVTKLKDDRLVADSRKLVDGTTFPSESISLSYNTKRLEPQEVVQTKRKWVAINVSSYAQLKDDPGWKGKLRTQSPNKYFLLKEQGMVYRYKEIGHKDGLPFDPINKWVQKNGDGQYEVTKGYENFHLSCNL